MKKLLIAGLLIAGIAGFAGTCAVTNSSLTTIGTNRTFAAQMVNNSGANVLQHSYTVAFLDAGNRVLETKTVPGCLRSLPNGQSDFFAATSANLNAYSALARLTTDSSMTIGTTTTGAVSLSGITVTRNAATLTVTGRMQNTDGVTLASPATCVVVYTAAGNVLTVGTSASTGSLTPGATATINVTLGLPDTTTPIGRVDVYVDGLKNGVPIAPVTQLNNAVSVRASSVAFLNQPGSSTGGIALPAQPIVILRDGAGATITTGAGSSQSVSLSLTGGTAGAVLTCNNNPVVAVAGTASFAGCRVDKAGNYQLIATTTGATSATSLAFNITVGPAARLAFTAPPPASSISSTPFATAPAVTVQDAGGNTVPSADSIQLTLASGAGTLAGCTAPVAAVNGTATFPTCAIDKAGSFTLRAHDLSIADTDAISGAFTITPGTATKLKFTTQPGGGAATAVWATQPAVTVQDAAGNTVTGSAVPITLTLTTGTGVLTCAVNPVNATTGVATFAGCKISLAGAGKVLTASSTGLTGDASAPFAIS